MNNKVLVIEDSQEIAEVISIYLTQNHYEVSVAKDGLHGVMIARANKPRDKLCYKNLKLDYICCG